MHGGARTERRDVSSAIARRSRCVDLGLSALLLLQGFTLFVAIPVAASHPGARWLLNLCHLGFAAISVGVLTRRRTVQAALLCALLLVALGPPIAKAISARLELPAGIAPDAIALSALLFNGLVTALVFGHVFAPGQVTSHRIRGAVLLYLNVAALFAITYGLLDMYAPGSVIHAGAAATAPAGGRQVADMSYFSLVTITTTGYGDLVPVHPVARSLAGLEAVFGQLFPATLLARLVALNLEHSRDGSVVAWKHRVLAEDR